MDTNTVHVSIQIPSTDFGCSFTFTGIGIKTSSRYPHISNILRMFHYIPEFTENLIIFFLRYPHTFSISKVFQYIPEFTENSIISFHGILF